MKRPWQSRKERWIDYFWAVMIVLVLLGGITLAIVKAAVLYHFIVKYW